MTRINEIEEKEYISLVNQALNDIEENELDKKSPAEVIKYGENRIKELNYGNNEMEDMYIANLLMPTIEQFKKIYCDNGKMMNVIVNKTGIPRRYIIARMLEINKYSKYLKGEKNMRDIEIIDGANEDKIKEKQPAKSVEEETKVAVAKINELLNLNEHKSETIERQNSSIKQLNNEIVQVEKKNEEANEKIKNQEQKIKELESQLFEARKEIQFLTKYKESYYRIVGLLDKPMTEIKETEEVKENKQI